ncbi:MAG: hypothetical protein IJJ74_01555 [Eubacterium sp.]|nr:hypothetical protein [Eubacterium sp.]
MIRRKSLVTGVFLITAILAVTACGKKDKKENTDTATESTEVTSEVVPIDMTKSYSRGRVDGQTYTNKFFNYSCTFDDEWRLYNDEEIDEINSFQAGAATDENVALVLEESYLLDMAAARYDGKGSISIMVGTISSGAFSERDYAESGLNAAAESMKQAGYTDVKAEIGTVSFCGRERVSINISAIAPPDASASDATKTGTDEESDTTEAADDGVEGSVVYEKQITAVNGRYISVLTFKADSEEDVNKIIAMFK